MMNYLKQLGEWVTDLKNNVFTQARIKLTLYYLFIIGIIMAVFSLLLYFSLVNNLSDNLQDKFENEKVQHQVFADASDNLQNVILISDIFSLAVLAFVSYFLAGRTLKPIKKSLDDQRQFSADASHELRTPLAVIQSESETALHVKKMTEAEYRKTISSTLEEVDRMKKIVEDLLIIARSENSKRTHFEKIDLSLMTKKVVLELTPIAVAKNIILTQNLEDSLKIKGNQNLVEHAILNVLQNALDYTPKDKSITVHIYKKEDQAILEITDTGIGIKEEDLPYIIQRFYKAKTSREQRLGGSGLGLAIVNQIVKEHKGVLNIKSIHQKGTTVTISFPIFS